MRSRFETLGRITLVLMLLSILVGCSTGGGGSQPILPDEEVTAPELTGDSNRTSENIDHYLLLYNLIYVDPDNPDGPIVEVIPVRAGELHINILKFLEVGPCTTCFKIVGFNFPEPGVLDVDIEITHPFSDLIFTIFDVRGIMMFNATHAFPASGLTISDSSIGDGELKNAEGYTQLYNGSTLGAAGDFFSYFKGKFATPTVPDADLNGFIRHITDDPANTRNALYSSDSVTQTYSLGLPSGEFVLGYAVDASWDMPVADPVVDPMTDFPDTANCIEPWKVEITEEPVGDGLTDVGGETKLLIDVYDWQGKETYHEPIVECPELFNDTLTATWFEDSPVYSRYEVTVSNALLADVGDYTCLISVEAIENDPGTTWWIDLTAYQIQMLTVTEKVTENPVAVATADPNPQLAGLPVHFSGLDSYDPDGGDIQLCEWDWDNDGVYEETGAEADHTWPDPGTYLVQLRVTDDEGETDELDLPLEIVITYIEVTSPNGGETLYGDESFEIQWEWTGDITSVYIFYSTDSGANYDGTVVLGTDCTGSYMWDPIPGIDATQARIKIIDVDNPATFDESDEDFTISYLIAGDGDLAWAKRAGGTDEDYSRDIVTFPDDSTAVTGYFSGSAIFGPKEVSETILTSAGGKDIFVARYNPDGTLAWAKRAGGTEDDQGFGIAILSYEPLVVTGFFRGTATFGKGETYETVLVSEGGSDIFVAKYNPNGYLGWAKRAGGTENEIGYAITTRSDNTTVVTGYFRGTATFGKGEAFETSLVSGGEADIFVARYKDDSLLGWAKRAGGTDNAYGREITTLSDDSTVIIGYFKGTATFGKSETNETVLVSYDESNDIFLARYNSVGTLVWAKHAGGTLSDQGYGITTLSNSSIVVTGSFRSTATFGEGEANETVLVSNGQDDIFVARYYPNGTLEWAVRAGGTLYDGGHGITNLSDDSTVVTGNFYESAIFGEGEANETVLVSIGQTDFFVARYNTDGTLAWVKRSGGIYLDHGWGITTLSDDSTVAIGNFNASATFGEGEPNETVLESDGSKDIFVARFAP